VEGGTDADGAPGTRPGFGTRVATTARPAATSRSGRACHRSVRRVRTLGPARSAGLALAWRRSAGAGAATPGLSSSAPAGASRRALRIPPLRERREDIADLAEGFVRAFARETGKAVRGVTVRALRALTDYDWPGNVRELEHEVRRLVYLCPDGGAIDSTMLSAHIVAPAPAPAAPAEDDDDASLLLEARVQRVEAKLVRQALARAGGNRSLAAKLLGISRNGLAIKMRRLGITD
jgi:hypothetical protein